MVGWDIHVWRPFDPPDTPPDRRTGLVAEWAVGPDGLDWLDALVAAGRADYLEGPGPPVCYSVPAGVLTQADAAPLGGWVDDPLLDRAVVVECPPDEPLFVEAWDVS